VTETAERPAGEQGAFKENPIMIGLDHELANEYLAESREHLASMEVDLLAIETAGAEVDVEVIARLFRAVHSIKGGARLFDLMKISELAHKAEEVLELIRSRKIVPTPACISVLLSATDRLSSLIVNPGASNNSDDAEITAALAGLSAAQQPSTEKSGRSEAGRAHPQPGHLRTLLVEDDFFSRILLQTFLSRYGDCHIAVNGREAVDAFRAAMERGEKYDLICMDLMMPEMNGREAVQHIRKLEEERGILSTDGAKIIMTTAASDIKDVIQCFKELCDAYLVKPIDLAQLLSQMKSYGLVQ
jgi:two-component system chemotaxis response regulator CheY